MCVTTLLLPIVEDDDAPQFRTTERHDDMAIADDHQDVLPVDVGHAVSRKERKKEPIKLYIDNSCVIRQKIFFPLS